MKKKSYQLKHQASVSMEIERNVTVLAAYKPFLHILTIYNWNNFETQKWHIWIRNACQAFVLMMLYIATIVAMLCDAWYCFRSSFHVADIALPFGIMINILQLAITYISIRMKSHLVDEVIASLEKIIIHRKWYLDIVFLLCVPTHFAVN